MADFSFPETGIEQPPQLYHLQDFSGINTNAPRPGIGDNEFAWLQNYFPIGPGNMRTLWSNGAPIYTAPGGKTIIYRYCFNLGFIQYCAVFLSDGTAVQVNLGTGATVTISSAANQFYSGTSLPAAVQWNASGIIIVTESTNPNGYYAWDGVTLYQPGQNAPNWLTNQTPTVMPSGIHGNAIETYQNRAWVTTPPETGNIPSIISQSGPGNGATFSGSSGGGSTPQQDSSLRASFTAVRQANGFLYYFGDSAIGVISNPQTSAGTTTYSNQNVDPQVGTSWPGTVQQFSSVLGVGILFANPQGIFLCVGGSAGKVSDDLNGLFNNIDTSFTPTASVAVIFGIRVYSLLIKTLDYTGATTFVMCMTDGKPKGAGFRWWLGSQDRPLSTITTAEINSSITTWADDGTNLFQCFVAPTTTLTKTMQSKLFTGPSAAEYIVRKKDMRFYYMSKDNAGAGVLLTGTLDGVDVGSAAETNSSFNAGALGNLIFTNNSNQPIIFVNNTAVQILFSVTGFLIFYQDAVCYGAVLGFTLTSTSKDFTLVAMTSLYSRDAPVGG